MRMRIIAIILFTVTCFIAHTQDAISYDWDKPNFDVSNEDVELNGIILKDFRSIYFKKLNTPYVNISQKRKTVHKRIYVNSDDVISSWNKVYIPTRNVKNVQRLQVRTINSDGNVTEFNQDNLKVIDNVDGMGQYTVFAIEGVEKGAIVEYLYDFDMDLAIYGTEIFQFGLPIKYAELYLYGRGFEFNLKGYNGAEVKTLKDGRIRNAYGGVMRDIPAFKEESYAANQANKMRVDYVATVLDWNSLGQFVSSNTSYTKLSIEKKIEKILNGELKINRIKSKKDKIAAIENYIKDNYLVIYDQKESLSDVYDILESKFSSEEGITYLFSAFFNTANIDFELVASCDRFRRRFDAQFSTPFNLEYFMFYFSDIDHFLAPFPFEYRNGNFPNYLVNQQGFSVAASFVKGRGINSSHRFVEIGGKDDFETTVTEDITVHFDKGDDVFISVSIGLTGYRAIDFISIYNQVPLDRRKDYATFYVPQSLQNQVNPKVIKLNGTENLEQDLTGETVTIYAELPGGQFIEKAGNSMIFKLGDLIGKQMELYQESARTQPIELDYRVAYDRSITLNYAEGYIIEGQEEILIHTDHLPDEIYKQMRFYSDYEEKDNQLIVSIDEFYDFIQMDKEYYPYFRDVINSAANFNKVSLLISHEDQ